MKIAFIIPQDNDRNAPFSQFAQCRVLPPVGLAKMAGQAGKHASVVLVDERVKSVKHEKKADIAVIFVNNYNSCRAYALASRYKQCGSHIVVTGPILAQSPAELERAESFADSLFISAGEHNMPAFMSDYIQGKTKRFYRESGNTDSAIRNPFISNETNWSLAS